MSTLPSAIRDIPPSAAKRPPSSASPIAPSKISWSEELTARVSERPSILELYPGPAADQLPGVDPCNGGGAGRPGCAGCADELQSGAVQQRLDRRHHRRQSNLEPETADTYSAGLAFTPAAISGLTLTADWFEIKVDDAIATNSATNILNSCANLDVFCDLIVRGSLGEVVQLTQAVVNLSRIEVAGVDTTARYRLARPASAISKRRWMFRIWTSSARSSRSRTARSWSTIAPASRINRAPPSRIGNPKRRFDTTRTLMALAWKTRYIGSSRDIPAMQ